jgi:hypothetical protein
MATTAAKDDLLALIASILLSGRDLKQAGSDESIKFALDVAKSIWDATHSASSTPQASGPEWPTPPEKWGWQ